MILYWSTMWIKRDFLHFLTDLSSEKVLPVKVLRGPRQVGKTSLLDYMGRHQLVLFDDLGVRQLANENPSLFFEQFQGPIILDEATLAPNIFPEIKKRVDEERRQLRTQNISPTMDIWITGSNQTLLHQSVRESLAGRANYYNLNTLSLHELTDHFKNFPDQYYLNTVLIRGGWPELYASPHLNPTQYLNDFVSTFIEKDIVMAAGIEKKAAFMKVLQLAAARVGQLLNFSDIAKNVGVDITTVQSWVALLEENGILRVIQPYFNNLNQRLIKTPKLYFEDIALAVRLQGWTQIEPLMISPYFGNLLENLVFIEISRFFSNRGESVKIYFLRSKEQDEIDFLIELPNNRYIAIEVKSTPIDMTNRQKKLLDSVSLNIVDRWIVTPIRSVDFSYARVIELQKIFEKIEALY